MTTTHPGAEDLVLQLLEAVLDNDHELALVALKAGSDPNIRDHDHPGPWRLFDVNTKGSFPLYECVNLCSRNVRRKKDTRVIEALLDHGALIDMVDDQGFSATHQAASMNNADALKLLIERGADVNIKSKKGYTPLHTAIYGRADACVDVLLGAGADHDLHNVDGLDCLEYARSLKRKEMAALLESRHAMEAMTRLLASMDVQSFSLPKTTNGPKPR
jgi:hypothetical protein